MTLTGLWCLREMGLGNLGKRWHSQDGESGQSSGRNSVGGSTSHGQQQLSKLLLFSHSVLSDSLQPHGLQHARLPYPSSSPGVCSNLCPLSQ